MRNIAPLWSDRALWARLAAALTLGFGLLSIAGWALGVHFLVSIVPGFVEMKMNTAVGVALCALALLCLSDRPSLRAERFAQMLSGVVAALGAATLAEYVCGVQLGIDEFLVSDHAGAYNVFRGRMSPFSAMALTSTAAALIAMPHPNIRKITLGGAACTLLIGLVSLLGYGWNVGELITDRWLPPVALNTAFCFAFLGGGALLVRRKAPAPRARHFVPLATVELKVLAGFATALALLVIGGSLTYRTNAAFSTALERVARTQEVRAALATVYGSLAGAEVALRDYVLTADSADRNEYQRLAHDALNHLDEVAFLTADNPIQRRGMAVLKPRVLGRMAAMAATRRAFGDFGVLAARAVYATNRNTDMLRDVSASIQSMDSEEVRMLTAFQRQMANVRATTLVSLLITLGIASSIFIAFFSGIRQEIRARLGAENALRASDRYNRSILESSPDCLCVLSLDGRLIHMTPRALDLMEIDDFSVFENAEWLKCWKGHHRADARAALDSARLGKPGHFEGFCPTFKGTGKWWDVMVTPVLGAEGRPECLLTAARDISKVKQQQRDLLELNRFLDSLFENLPLMVFVKEAATLRYVRTNRECERVTGMARETVIGRTARDVAPPDEADRDERSDTAALASGRLIEVLEETVQTPELGQRTRHTMKVPIVDEGGTPRYLLGISTDITSRKLAEQAIHELNAALQAKAAQLEITNTELESFSYSVSHDLRAPLRAIDGFALMVEEDYSDRLDAEGRRYLAVIRENSKRMGMLIDDLLAFSKLGRLPLVTLEFNTESLVREVVAEALIGHDKTIPRVDIGPLPPSRGDARLLRQVWMNLICNAIKYSSKNAAPHIMVSGRQDGAETCYSVSDNGVGFSMEYADKLFGVFQRLHRADEFSGTGVGLAIVHRVVTRHGGRVWAAGKINAGAEFSFALPREV